MTKEHVLKVLQEIQQRVPLQLRQRAYSEQKISPTVSKMVDMAIADPEYPADKKEHLSNLKQQGYFDKAEYVMNDKIATQINNFVDREINKAIKQGRLPTKNKIREILNAKN